MVAIRNCLRFLEIAGAVKFLEGVDVVLLECFLASFPKTPTTPAPVATAAAAANIWRRFIQFPIFATHQDPIFHTA